ncbi:MAG: thermonuclease family protein [Acidimicrobiales bacterium]
MQLALGVVTAMVLLSPFTSDGVQTVAAGGTPATNSVVTTAVLVTKTAPATAPAPTAIPAGEDTAVVRVVDGDTIMVTGGTRVRLIGIDTPETVDPSSPVQCFGPEATRYANALLPVGTPIRLVYDVERLDRYGRTLAYVYRTGDGVFVNLAMARDGLAAQLTVPPNVAHAEEIRVAVAEARTANLGLWAACPPAAAVAPVPTTRAPIAPSPTTAALAPRLVAPTPTTAAPRPTTTPAAPASGCHPSYAGACVPMGFSDVDCAGGSGNGPGYVSAKNFQVVGPDLYRLDSDGDGIACESR